MSTQGAYAKAGVDPTKIEPFKQAMKKVAEQTFSFPNKRDVYIIENALAHGGTWEYRGKNPVLFCNTSEGLGNKNWVAEWMYTVGKVRQTYYDKIAQCMVRMATNDVIAQGALPIVYTDVVEAGDSEWFEDTQRTNDFARGILEACKSAGMALVAGESPSLKYLVNSKPPVRSAPTLSGTVTGIISPASLLITGERLAVGDQIIGIGSSGPHSNGYSLMIKEAMKLPNKFLTRIPGTKLVLGEEMLKATRCYVGAAETLFTHKIDVHALLPGTGGGVSKLSFDRREFTYHIDYWPDVPPLFLYFHELLSMEFGEQKALEECLKTFNWHVGYYVFVPKNSVDYVCRALFAAQYPAWRVGEVREGPRGTRFATKEYLARYKQPLWLNPPGH